VGAVVLVANWPVTKLTMAKARIAITIPMIA
jgi:hypothetical protein